MISECQKIVIEKAKNGEPTCRILLNNKWMYLYSKYRPRDSVKLDCPQSKGPHVLLGLGLGYELESLRKQTKEKIIVFEKHSIFINFLSSHPELKYLLKDPLITFCVEEDALLAENFPKHFNVIRNRVSQLDEPYYNNILARLIRKKRHKKRILFFEHITIADDCIYALKKMGYDVIKCPKLPKEELITFIKKKIQTTFFQLIFQKSFLKPLITLTFQVFFGQLILLASGCIIKMLHKKIFLSSTMTKQLFPTYAKRESLMFFICL